MILLKRVYLVGPEGIARIQDDVSGWMPEVSVVARDDLARVREAAFVTGPR